MEINGALPANPVQRQGIGDKRFGAQKNLAFDPQYAAILDALKAGLAAYADTSRHPFPREADDFYFGPQWHELAARTRGVGTQEITWWPTAKVKANPHPTVQKLIG